MVFRGAAILSVCFLIIRQDAQPGEGLCNRAPRAMLQVCELCEHVSIIVSISLIS